MSNLSGENTNKPSIAALVASYDSKFTQYAARVRAQDGFLDEHHPYAVDPHSAGELP